MECYRILAWIWLLLRLQQAAPFTAAAANAATLDRWTDMKSEGQFALDKRIQMAAAYQVPAR